MQALKREEYFTYADYLTWDDDVRYELIDGTPYMMGSPSSTHQWISMQLSGQFYNFLKGKQCRIFHAPYDVRLNPAKEDDTVVQPDLVIICDRSKIDKKGCKGVPDMIIEILSPSTLNHDRVTKFYRYLEAGVREYWIVDPDSRLVSTHILRCGEYVTNAYDETKKIPVHVLEGCIIDLADVFEN